MSQRRKHIIIVAVLCVVLLVGIGGAVSVVQYPVTLLVLPLALITYYAIGQSRNKKSCPYCGAPIILPIKRSRKCSNCSQKIYVSKGKVFTDKEKMRRDAKKVRKRMSLFKKTNRESLLQYKKEGLIFYEILATEDDYTCKFCKGMDRRKIRISTGLANQDLIPPFPNCENYARDGCRCCALPVVSVAQILKS